MLLVDAKERMKAQAAPRPVPSAPTARKGKR